MVEAVMTKDFEWDYFDGESWVSWGTYGDGEFEYCFNAENGDVVYFCPSGKRDEIYTIQTNIGEKQLWVQPLPIKIEGSDDYFNYPIDSGLYLYNGWLYFIQKSDWERYAEFYRMRPDGSGCVMLHSIRTGSDYHTRYEITGFEDGWIYYNVFDYSFVTGFKIRVDGSENLKSDF